MAMVITEKELEEACQALLPGEPVLAVGLFQPYGSGMATGLGAGEGENLARGLHLPGAAGIVASAAVGYAAHRGMAAAEHQPAWTAMAVTADRIYAFDASDAAGITATRHFSGPPYAQWNRSEVAVHVSRHVTQFTMAVDDPADGTSWEYTGNQIYKSGGKLVAHLLADTPG